MGHPEFRTVAVGLDDKHVVQRIHNGEVRYLAAQLDKSKMARLSLDLAEGTCKVLRNGPDRATDERAWLPWPADALPMRSVPRMATAASI